MNEEELRARIVELETENNALKNEIFERDWEALCYESEYEINKICDNEEVATTKSFLSDWHCNCLIPLVNKWGYEKTNERVMQEITSRQIEKAKEACEDACCEK